MYKKYFFSEFEDDNDTPLTDEMEAEDEEYEEDGEEDEGDVDTSEMDNAEADFAQTADQSDASFNDELSTDAVSEYEVFDYNKFRNRLNRMYGSKFEVSRVKKNGSNLYFEMALDEECKIKMGYNRDSGVVAKIVTEFDDDIPRYKKLGDLYDDAEDNACDLLDLPEEDLKHSYRKPCCDFTQGDIHHGKCDLNNEGFLKLFKRLKSRYGDKFSFGHCDPRMNQFKMCDFDDDNKYVMINWDPNSDKVCTHTCCPNMDRVCHNELNCKLAKFDFMFDKLCEFLNRDNEVIFSMDLKKNDGHHHGHHHHGMHPHFESAEEFYNSEIGSYMEDGEEDEDMNNAEVDTSSENTDEAVDNVKDDLEDLKVFKFNDEEPAPITANDTDNDDNNNSSDDDEDDMNDNTGADFNADYNTEATGDDATDINNLIALENEVIDACFEAAKKTQNDLLGRLYSDIGSDIRFQVEQLLYAKSQITGEKYEPRDPQVRAEYEKLTSMGMGSEDAMNTAIDKTSLNSENITEWAQMYMESLGDLTNGKKLGKALRGILLAGIILGAGGNAISKRIKNNAADMKTAIENNPELSDALIDTEKQQYQILRYSLTSESITDKELKREIPVITKLDNGDIDDIVNECNKFLDDGFTIIDDAISKGNSFEEGSETRKKIDERLDKLKKEINDLAEVKNDNNDKFKEAIVNGVVNYTYNMYSNIVNAYGDSLNSIINKANVVTNSTDIKNGWLTDDGIFTTNGNLNSSEGRQRAQKYSDGTIYAADGNWYDAQGNKINKK